MNDFDAGRAAQTAALEKLTHGPEIRRLQADAHTVMGINEITGFFKRRPHHTTERRQRFFFAPADVQQHG